MNVTKYHGFDVFVHKLGDTWVGVATSPDHVITTKHQTTEHAAARIVCKMVDAYRTPELTERLVKSLERTQIGCTISELMAWHGTTRDAAHAVVTRLMKVGCVRNVPEQVVDGAAGRRGRYWITDVGRAALDAYLAGHD